jgi:hypothetical protein
MGGGYATPIPLRTVHTTSPTTETGRTDQWLNTLLIIWFLSGSGYVLTITQCWELMHFPVTSHANAYPIWVTLSVGR